MFGDPDRPGESGELSDTSPAELCRTLAARGATGVLELEGPDGTGRVALTDGQIVVATAPTPSARLGDRLVGAGLLDVEALEATLDAQGDAAERPRLGALLVERGHVSRDAVRLFVQEQVFDALFAVLRWRYGIYRFTPGGPGATVPEVPLSIAVDEAIVEISRRQREWEELSQVIPNLEAVPAFRESSATTNAALEPDEFAVLASVDGARSIRELAGDLGYGEFETARIVYGLSLLGVVDVRIREDEVGAALDDALEFVSSDPTAATQPPWDADTESRPAPDEPSFDPDQTGAVIEAELPAGGDLLGTVLPRPTPVGGRPAPTDPTGEVEPTGGSATPPQPFEHADRGEVSEFLRELSRLAIEDEPPTAARTGDATTAPQRDEEPAPTKSGRPSGADEPVKRKRRSLFGRS